MFSWNKTTIMQRECCLSWHATFFLLQQHNFVPMLVLFVQQPTTQLQTVNISSTLNWCARKIPVLWTGVQGKFQYSELVCKENSSTLNWCARKIPVRNHWSATTVRNNHNRDIFNSHLFFTTSVLFLNYFKQFILYGWWKTKDFNKINCLSLNESKKQSLWTNEWRHQFKNIGTKYTRYSSIWNLFCFLI